MADLVCDVLRNAPKPLRPIEIRLQLEARLGHAVNKGTVLYVLQQSQLAKSGKIIRLDGGTYLLDEPNAPSPSDRD
ncbi:MAG: hypothetical protein JHD02_09470 [Thermoleophilaceae bacterium]|nr:hypothetical protein [Thermoleophilaceae bacterium]